MADDGSETHDARLQEEVAKKYARLNDEQRQDFHKSVNRVIEKNGEVSDQHRLAVANTLLQPLRGIDQRRQIKEAERREEQRAFWNDLRCEHEPQGAIKQAQPQAGPVRQGGDQATPGPAKHDSLMAGVRPSGAHRNYAELKKTHQQVASALKQDDGPAAAQQYELSKEHLQGMLDHYEALRRTGNISPTPEEMRERDDVSRLQQTSCVELEQKHGPHPNAHQQEERKLMDHQHLAEQVGVEARWMAQHLRKQQAPGAETCESDARRAFHTARITHERRQNLGRGPDRAQETTRIVQQQEQQKQSATQEALRGGTEMTPDQRANASADVRQAIDRKERAAASREADVGATSRRVQKEMTRPGNTRGGGRSR
jgi:hypothetical protein